MILEDNLGHKGEEGDTGLSSPEAEPSLLLFFM